MWRSSRLLINTFHRIRTKNYHVLAIESSCDDSSVCIIDRNPEKNTNDCLWHETNTLDSTEAGGIIPGDALAHHLRNVAPMIQKALKKVNLRKADLICATRGPGMYASIASGFNVAKGLAVAWDAPLIGVHHMLGHLLMPRYFSGVKSPSYPFLSLLASGGHTMLVLSESISQHKILVNTMDIAVGDSIDKCAREIGLKGNCLGKCLEDLVRGYQLEDRNCEKHKEYQKITFSNPLKRKRISRDEEIEFAFSGFISALRSALKKHPIVDEDSRAIIGTKIQHAHLYHITSRIKVALNLQRLNDMDFVVAGGVASNKYLRNLLISELSDFNMSFHFLDPQYCTDNALMIGWAGIELWENCKIQTHLSALPVAKWPLTELMTAGDWIPSTAPSCD